jgi:hypothetical protein
MDAQEWELLPARKRLKLPAGVGDPVDLMKGVGEKRHTGD